MPPDATRSDDLPGRFPPTGLIDARKELHHALQVVAAAARSYAPERPDDAHSNLGWHAACDALVTRPLGEDDAPRVALRFDRRALAVVDADGTCAELTLAGRVRTELAGWVRTQLAVRDLDPAAYRHERPYEMPHHPVMDGARWLEPNDVAAGTPEELGRWFALAAPALEEVAAREPGASPVRCWPHHFDLATLITLDEGEDPEDARSVGVGLSPGDETLEQPYLYVTPWPKPASDVALPALPAGHWHTEGFTAAVLTGEELLAESAEPPAALRAFLDAAVPAARGLL